MHKNEEHLREDSRRYRVRAFIITALLNIGAMALLLFMYLVVGLQSFTDDKSDQVDAIEGLLFVFNPLLGLCLRGESMTIGRGASAVILWALFVGFVFSWFLAKIRKTGREAENQNAESK